MVPIKQIFKKGKKKLIKFDNERLAIGLVSLLGLGLLLPLLIIEPGLLEAEWFLDLLSIPAEYASFITGAAYIGRLVNILTARSFTTENKEEKTKVKTFLSEEVVMGRQILVREKELTPVGMFLGMLLAIACIVLHVTVPFLNIFSYFAYILFILGYACSLGGLFNRLGSSVDGTRLSQEKKAILFGAVFGCVFAFGLIIVLATTGTLPLIAVAGISKVFFDLFVLHKTLFTFIFIFSLTSVSTSFFDYFAKAICFLKYKYHLGVTDIAINERLESRYHEYCGAFWGATAGCLLAIGIVTGLILTSGLIAAPMAVGVTIFITFITCSSMFSALFSRIGRVIDGFNRISVADEERKDKKQVILISDENETLKNNRGLTHSNSINVKNLYNKTLQNCFSYPQVKKVENKVKIYFNANVLALETDQEAVPINKNSYLLCSEGDVETAKKLGKSNESFDSRKNHAAFFLPDKKSDVRGADFVKVACSLS
ncbi:MAG: hypothetical protein V4471_02650 [Pseudomonadota bacterium]